MIVASGPSTATSTAHPVLERVDGARTVDEFGECACAGRSDALGSSSARRSGADGRRDALGPQPTTPDGTLDPGRGHVIAGEVDPAGGQSRALTSAGQARTIAPAGRVR